MPSVAWTCLYGAFGDVCAVICFVCQMSSALAELEGRLKRSTEELQASETQASRAREWHEARHAELLRSLSAAEQAASDAAAQAEAAAADKNEAVRAAEENLDAMQKEKVPYSL